jgi:DNA-binding CsgD family transcriptional regulator
VIVGRDEELGVLEALLGAGPAEPGPWAVALEGEAGIGKSTLWREVVDAARARGVRVLAARPAESEQTFAYAGLGDLLDGLLPDLLAELTPPQRRALEVALLVGDETGGPADQHALGVAVRSSLQLLSEDRLVVAIDDLQWLDAPTARVLAFAVRRLPETPLHLVWTRRVAGRAAPSPVEEALDADRLRRIEVGSLSVGAIHRIVTSRYDRPLPRPTLLRLYEISGGNPFYALELVRALGDEEATRDPTRPLPVPERLEELLATRLAAFTGPTRDALVLAAADARLTVRQLRALGLDPVVLEPAVAERVVERSEDAIRFTHPLLASVLDHGLSPTERQRAHRRLASVAEEPLARARHLALSADGPDAGLASQLERAATAAAASGTPIVAAELGEHALRLTPSAGGVDLDRRAAAVARAHLASGEAARARTLAAELVARSASGLERARALLLVADAEAEDIQRSIALLEEALREASADAALQATIHQQLSLAIRFTSGLRVAEGHARAAVELADMVADDALRASARASLALVRFNAGEADALELAESAEELASRLPEADRRDAPFVLAHVLVWSHRLDRARDLLERLHAVWSDRDERLSANALWYLSLVELRAGSFRLAEDYAWRCHALTVQYATEGDESPQDVFMRVLAAAHLGDLEQARELAVSGLRRAARHASQLMGPPAALGMVELWRGDVEAAVALFSSAEEIADAGDHGEPSMSWWRAEQVEALLALGRIDDAAERLDAWKAAGRRLDRPWVVAQAVRCSGLVASARGDLDGAARLLEEAIAAHEAVRDPFGRGRALLALGTVLRRAKQKRDARGALEAAVAVFEETGAAGWAERAREELARIGGRTTSGGLTPSERRVADLVAQGRTNAEVASALFLSQRTVASHLTHVYAKLGVRSRTELARRLG